MADLATLRERIEVVDRKIIELIAERLSIVEGVVEAKLASASPFRDREREESLIGQLRAIAVEVGVDPHQIERLYRVVMDMSVAHQEQLVRDRAFAAAPGNELGDRADGRPLHAGVDQLAVDHAVRVGLADRHGLANFCRVLFSLNEFVFID